MVFLHAVAQREIQNDPIALAMVLVIIVAFAIMVIRKNAISKKQAAAVETPEVVVEEVSAPTAPGSAGSIKLHNVEPKTAAMVMAIVAEKTGKPLNELRFISIKEVE